MAKIEKLKEQAFTHLDSNEKVVATVMGAYESKIMGKDTVRNGVFIATDKRIVFYGKKMLGYDLEFFPLSNISSIEVSKGLMGHTISFFASGNKVNMKWINVGEVQKFINYVKESVGKKRETAAHIDSTEELRKYKSLLDEGIITEEEFDAKKKQILGI